MRFTSVTVCRSIGREQDEKISTRLLTGQIEWMEKMSLQSEFETLAGASCDNRVYPNVAPAETAKPCLTYFRVSSVPATLDMDSEEVSQLFNTVLQVDAIAATYTEAVNLAYDVRMRLREWDRQNKIRLEKDLYEVETGLHHVVLEISVWHP